MQQRRRLAAHVASGTFIKLDYLSSDLTSNLFTPARLLEIASIDHKIKKMLSKDYPPYVPPVCAAMSNVSNVCEYYSYATSTTDIARKVANPSCCEYGVGDYDYGRCKKGYLEARSGRGPRRSECSSGTSYEGSTLCCVASTSTTSTSSTSSTPSMTPAAWTPNTTTTMDAVLEIIFFGGDIKAKATAGSLGTRTYDAAALAAVSETTITANLVALADYVNDATYRSAKPADKNFSSCNLQSTVLST